MGAGLKCRGYIKRKREGKQEILEIKIQLSKLDFKNKHAVN